MHVLMSATYPECDVHTLSVKVRTRPLASSTTPLRKYEKYTDVYVTVCVHELVHTKSQLS